MDKQDVNRVARSIRSLMSEKRYEEVIRIAEKLNLGKVNNGLLILNIVEAYENIGEKAAAKNTLFSYYDVHGITGRNMMQKLIELCIETKDISNAVGLCIQFENEWPDDSISYLMRYQITASGNGSYDEQIHYLEKYKEYEFEERWGYELAGLYEKNNQWEESARICHELICFFGDGKYVEKAARLKERISGLTDEEIMILETAENRRKMAEKELAETRDSYYEPDMDSVPDKDPDTLQNSHEESLWNQTLEMQHNETCDTDEWNDNRYDSDDFYIETSEAEASEFGTSGPEDAFAYKTREAEVDKIRQTEEAAKALRTRKENERMERERKIADAFRSSDRYAQLEKGRTREIHFREFSKPNVGEEQSAPKVSNKGIFSSISKVTDGFRKSLRTDEEEVYDSNSEIEYITIGRDSKAYIEDIEERMLSELDMLDDEQIDRLTAAQIKEIYELKVLREVREKVAEMLSSSLYKYDEKMAAAELETFIDTDPYRNPIEDTHEDEELDNRSELEKDESNNGTESTSEDVSDEEKKKDVSACGKELKEESAEAEEPEKKETEIAETENTEESVETDEEAKVAEVTEETETAMEEAEVNAETVEEATEAEVDAEEPVHTILDDITDSDAPLSNEVFLKCVVSYAGTKGYIVEETAYMTIAVVAEEMQEKNVVLSLNNAKVLTEQAILRAQKRSHMDKIFDKYSKKRMYILKDRHFVWK